MKTKNLIVMAVAFMVGFFVCSSAFAQDGAVTLGVGTTVNTSPQSTLIGDTTISYSITGILRKAGDVSIYMQGETHMLVDSAGKVICLIKDTAGVIPEDAIGSTVKIIADKQEPVVESPDLSMITSITSFEIIAPPDEIIEKIRRFAYLLKEDPLDINKDGVIDGPDQALAKDGYSLAFKYLKYLPKDVKTILDRDQDGNVNENDRETVVLNISEAIQDIEKITEFAKIIDPRLDSKLDVNRDGVVDEKDATALETALKNTVDINGDGEVDSTDLNRMHEIIKFVSMGITYYDKYYADVNRDGKVDQADIDLFKASLDPKYDLNLDGKIDYSDSYYLNSIIRDLTNVYSEYIYGGIRYISLDNGYYKVEQNADGTYKLTLYNNASQVFNSSPDGTIVLSGKTYTIYVENGVVKMKAVVSADTVTRLDLNGDGVVNSKDTAVINQMLQARVDLNRDGKIDEKDAERIAYVIEALKFNVTDKELALADINKDGKVNEADLTLLENAIETAIDVNGDGRVDAEDVAALRRIINSSGLKIYDINIDGRIDQEDVLLARENYDLANLYAKYLPQETFDILDQDKDGAINNADTDIFVSSMSDVISGIEMVEEFAKLLAEDPLDLNRDGIIDDKDVNFGTDRCDLAVKYSTYLSQEARAILDKNGDGILDTKDTAVIVGSIKEVAEVIRKARERVDSMVYDESENPYQNVIEDYIKFVKLEKLDNGNYSVLIEVDNFQFELEMAKYGWYGQNYWYVVSTKVSDITGNYPAKIIDGIASLFNCGEDDIVIYTDPSWYGFTYNKTDGTVGWRGYVKLGNKSVNLDGIYDVNTLDAGIRDSIKKPILAVKKDVIEHLGVNEEEIKITDMGYAYGADGYYSYYQYVEAAAKGFKIRYAYTLISHYDPQNGNYNTDVSLILKSIVTESGIDLVKNAVEYLKEIVNPDESKVDAWRINDNGEIELAFVLKDGSRVAVFVDTVSGTSRMDDNLKNAVLKTRENIANRMGVDIREVHINGVGLMEKVVYTDWPNQPIMKYDVTARVGNYTLTLYYTEGYLWWDRPVGIEVSSPEKEAEGSILIDPKWSGYKWPIITLTSFVDNNTGRDYVKDAEAKVLDLLNPEYNSIGVDYWSMADGTLTLGIDLYHQRDELIKRIGGNIAVEINLSTGEIRIDQRIVDAATKVRQETSKKLNIGINDVHVNSIWQERIYYMIVEGYPAPEPHYTINVSTPQFKITYNYTAKDSGLKLISLVSKEIGQDLYKNAVDYLKEKLNQDGFELDNWAAVDINGDGVINEKDIVGFDFKLKDGSVVKIDVNIETGEPQLGEKRIKELVEKDALSRDWNFNGYGSRYSPITCGATDITAVEYVGNGIYKVKAKLSLVANYGSVNSDYSYKFEKLVEYYVDSNGNRVTGFVYDPNNQSSAVKVEILADREIRTTSYVINGYFYEKTVTVYLDRSQKRVREEGYLRYGYLSGDNSYITTSSWQVTFDSEGRYPVRYTTSYETKANGAVVMSGWRSIIYGQLGYAVESRSRDTVVQDKQTSTIYDSLARYDYYTHNKIFGESRIGVYVNGKLSSEKVEGDRYTSTGVIQQIWRSEKKFDTNGRVTEYKYEYWQYDSAGKLGSRYTETSKYSYYGNGTLKAKSFTNMRFNASGVMTSQYSYGTSYNENGFVLVDKYEQYTYDATGKPLSSASSIRTNTYDAAGKNLTKYSYVYNSRTNGVSSYYNKTDVTYGQPGYILEYRNEYQVEYLAAYYNGTTYKGSSVTRYDYYTHRVTSSEGKSSTYVNGKIRSEYAYGYNYNTSGIIQRSWYSNNTYNENGKLTENRYEYWQYDSAGKLSWRYSQISSYSYDSNGILRGQKSNYNRYNGSGILTSAYSYSTTYNEKGAVLESKYEQHLYDNNGKPVSSYSGVTSYTYDTAGRITDVSGQYKNFDGNNKLISETRSTTAYTYNQNGKLIKMAYSYKTYDGDSRLLTSYGYTADYDDYGKFKQATIVRETRTYYKDGVLKERKYNRDTYNGNWKQVFSVEQVSHYGETGALDDFYMMFSEFDSNGKLAYRSAYIFVRQDDGSLGNYRAKYDIDENGKITHTYVYNEDGEEVPGLGGDGFISPSDIIRKINPPEAPIKLNDENKFVDSEELLQRKAVEAEIQANAGDNNCFVFVNEMAQKKEEIQQLQN